ncbi:MAG TPA: hypothetical protein VN947_00070 [Polyangia bacterium]|nr:hypothetical protein [Polyangia bacterium]
MIPLDENKKPGPRDISDLKARLGLKKTAAMPAAAPAPTPAHGQPATQQQPVPPPSGYGAPAPQQPSGPPPPFGRREEPPPPQPAAPADPRRDPFASAQQQQAAANLAAFYGLGQALPGSADSVSGDSISKPKLSGRLVIFLISLAVIFGVGNACGRIQRDRIEYNTTTDQAGQIREEVEKMSKTLSSIVDALNSTPAGRKGDVDIDLSAKLGAMDLKKPDTVRIFHTNYNSLEPVIVERLMQYYDGTIKLYDEIQVHAKKTDNDKDALTRMAQAGAKSDKNYGVIVQPQGGLMIAQFVEVGQPVCQQEGKTDCNANELKGFQYRMDSGSGWGTRPVKGKPEAIVMPLQQTPLFKAVAAGNPDFLAVKDYARRMAEIKTQAAMLMNQQKDVLSDLKKSSERPKLFAF